MNGGAPSPGVTAPGGIYGPDDGYISGAVVGRVIMGGVSLSAIVVGGWLAVM